MNSDTFSPEFYQQNHNKLSKVGMRVSKSFLRKNFESDFWREYKNFPHRIRQGPLQDQGHHVHCGSSCGRGV